MPDFDTAKIELSSTSDLISLSAIISQLSKFDFSNFSVIKFIFSMLNETRKQNLYIFCSLAL